MSDDRRPGAETPTGIISLDAYRKRLSNEREQRFTDSPRDAGELINECLTEYTDKPPEVDTSAAARDVNRTANSCLIDLVDGGFVLLGDMHEDFDHEPGEPHLSINVYVLRVVLDELKSRRSS